MIRIKIDGQEYEFEKNIRIEKIIKKIKPSRKIILAAVNNQLRELTYEVSEDAVMELLSMENRDARKTYMRSLSFLFIRACSIVFPKSNVSIEHSLGGGLYCEVDNETYIGIDQTEKITEKMRDLIQMDIPIEKLVCRKDEAVEIFKRENKVKKAELLKDKKSETVTVYELDGMKDYFYGYMVPSTSYLDVFSLKHYNDGIIILGSEKFDDTKSVGFIKQAKMAEIFKETKEWGKIMGVNKVVDLNNLIDGKEHHQLIRTIEALHEKKISNIADMITESGEKGRVILIAGPSSSGKTSFAHRLSTQLRVNKLRPVSISLDDYFVNREDTPLDENGDYDFESIFAIDLELFNSHLEELLKGNEVEIPKFDFKQGRRVYNGNRLRIKEDQPIIIEGIHGLNDMLTKSIPNRSKFKIYVSALTQLNLDEHNRIPTTDLRLIRRIVRDNQFRGNDALRTIQLWKSVRRGEEKNIFPFQEEADVMFNSALVYELSVLKKYVTPLLEKIEEDQKEHREAKRLLKFLQYFRAIEEEDDIPPTSILKEFIGGSRIVH